MAAEGFKGPNRRVARLSAGDPYVDHLRRSECERTASGRTCELRQRRSAGRDCSCDWGVPADCAAPAGEAYAACGALRQSVSPESDPASRIRDPGCTASQRARRVARRWLPALSSSTSSSRPRDRRGWVERGVVLVRIRRRKHWEWMRAGTGSCQAGRRAAPPDSGTLLERTGRGCAVVEDGANYAIAGVLWRVAARLRIAVSTTSGWESIGTWLLSTA